VNADNDIAEFLTSRRANVTPERAGLPSYGKRRVAGLRREEVASLAGVSADYYRRLERGQVNWTATHERRQPQPRRHQLRRSDPRAGPAAALILATSRRRLRNRASRSTMEQARPPAARVNRSATRDAEIWLGQ
jgi:hypothetical protein